MSGPRDATVGPRPGEAILAGVRVGGRSPVRLMAVLNVSPESFYPGSVWSDAEKLRRAAEEAVAAGADFLDVGAMSTAPYLDTSIEPDEERRRLVWALDTVGKSVPIPISADTSRAAVAAAALDCGARILNDVTGLGGDPGMAEVAARYEGIVLMAHPAGDADDPPLVRVRRLLAASLARAGRAGIPFERIVVDPGIGFFPRASLSPIAFNCALLARLGELAELGRPLLVGLSRKSFVGELTGKAAADRLAGSLGATAIAVYNGAAVIRTHDVAATRDAVRVAEAIRDGRQVY